MPITPRTWLSLTEVPRAGLDITALFSAAPFLRMRKPGDGHPVLVYPGFLADDDSTWLLRQYLRHLGYQTHPWAQQRNLGVTAMGGYTSLVQQVLGIHRQSGQRVSIIGWSLGGVHALAVAHRAEYAVRNVITLGSPLLPPRVPPGADGLDNSPKAEADARTRQNDSIRTRKWRNIVLKMPDSLPISSIYSRTDGVVPWRRSQLPAGPQRENIEVLSSHIGLGYNPAVLFAIADRLAQDKGEFTPFHRHGLRQLAYPNPGRARFA